ncbi:SGNH/GDSL hydrolase family protein [Pimelobacter simplex]|uniref:SGNH/GDSL hydrolase family protein n=1 Tax=Nocardioides simplex TaxID=2045 RepID=UPI001931DCCC|nr:SGNH/GDSL hydrolase family protein [Pimelobacter simplex]
MAAGPVQPRTLRHPDAVRLLAFVLAVMALFVVARQGQTQAVMYAAFAAFLVTATLWVRGLDANWVEGREDYGSWPLLVLALAVPVVVTILIGVFLERSLSTFVLGALITAYIAAGLAIRKLRWRVIQGDPVADRVFRWQVLAGLLLVAYGALWLFGRAPTLLAGALLLVAVVPVPALVHVLSERRIIAQSLDGAERERALWILGGAAATALSLVVGVAFLAETRYLLILVVVVVVLTWAFAVGSLADIAMVLALLALMGLTPASQDVKPVVLSAKASAPKPGAPEPVVVSLGDSYSSGEGAARYLDSTNVAGGNQCRRAATAWPVLAAQALDAHRLVFRACSGARARNVVGRPGDDQQYAGEGIQAARALAELRSADPDLVPALILLSIGGNDSGFRQVGSSCLSMGSCDDAEVSAYFYDNLPDVEEALRATYLAIAATFPDAPIAVMPYPDAFATDDGCVRAPVETGDIRFVRAFTDRLDDTIEKVAGETGAYYVAPMRSALTESHLALCDESGTPGLNFLDLRGVGGAALDRFNPGNWIHSSLHPNERGHAALAAAFTGWLSSQRRPDADGNELVGLPALLPPAAKRSLDGVPEPPTDLPVPTLSTTTLCFEKGGECGPQADAWALGRLGPGMVLPLLLTALAAGGSWVLAVGVSAQRFRRRAAQASPPSWRTPAAAVGSSMR